MRSKIPCFAAAFAAFLCLWTLRAPRADGNQASSSEENLRAAGIEPSAAGVEKYLNSLLDGEAAKAADALIAELADEKFEVRERAALRLLAMGTMAIDRLEAATKDADAERAWRAKTLLRKVQSAGDSPVLVALRFVREKKLPVGVPLLVKLCERTSSPQVRETATQALLAIAGEDDRPAADALLKHDEVALRNVGRRMLARLDGGEAPMPLLEGAFDAVAITPGSVAGGGPNLIDGWEFKPKVDLVVTHLGLYDHGADGLTVAHPIAIWRIDDAATPVVIATIPGGNETTKAGAFRLIESERAVLKAGERYAIVALYPDVSDSTVGLINPQGLTVEVADHIEVAGRRYSFPHRDMAFPANVGEGAVHACYGPTFRYEATPK
jgi:hypothetical protein